MMQDRDRLKEVPPVAGNKGTFGVPWGTISAFRHDQSIAMNDDFGLSVSPTSTIHFKECDPENIRDGPSLLSFMFASPSAQ